MKQTFGLTTVTIVELINHSILSQTILLNCWCWVCEVLHNGPLTRYVNLRVAHAPGNNDYLIYSDYTASTWLCNVFWLSFGIRMRQLLSAKSVSISTPAPLLLVIQSTDCQLLISRGVSRLATDSPCGVWGRGWTTYLLHAGPLFGSHFKMRVGM